MDLKLLEERKNNRGGLTYWRDGILIYKQCSKCKNIKSAEEFSNQKNTQDGKSSCCRECRNKIKRERYISKHGDEIQKYEDIEGLEKRVNQFGSVSYWKDDVKIRKQCTVCKQIKDMEEFSVDKREKDGRCIKCKECRKQYRKTNKEHIHQYWRQYYEINKEHRKEQHKQYRENNKEHLKEYIKERYEFIKKEQITKISSLLKEINPLIKKLNLPIYGTIYKIENTKTGRVYIGQTILPLKERYKGGIIKGWLKERKERIKQKYLDELKNEEDFKVAEFFKVGICQYHLDKLEAYYIDKYDSYNNGYNNMEGKYLSTDGLEEFKEMLNKYNLKYINGELKENG